MRILAIGAHPDDCEIYCGGTLAKYAKLGHDVFMVSVTNGEVGSTTLQPDEISAIRKKEGEAAAKVIGAEYIWLGYQDQAFFVTPQARLDFIDLYRYVKPDVVLTHYPDLYSNDHFLTGKLANDTAIMAKKPNIESKYPHINNVPMVYFFDTPAGVGFQPDEYVDITDYIDVKRKMILCHKTQDDFMIYNVGSSITEESDVVARLRGLQVAVLYAEGFKRAQYWGRNMPSSLLP